jgi:phosphohistidine phosphatase
MELILLRHGKAQETSKRGDDARELVAKGREQARRAGKLLLHAKALPELVLTSPLTRAKQTADEFCEAAEMPGPIVQGWLACGMGPETALRELSGFSEFERVAIVGHEPDLSSLIEYLLGVSAGSVRMKKGALACVSIHPPARFGTLRYLIPPRFDDDLS